MRDTDYAFCVAKLRANERYMLTDDFIRSLIDASDYDSAVSMLRERGWITDGDNIAEYINTQNQALLELLFSSVPDKDVLSALFIANDCYNIKAAVKCRLSGEAADKYYISPTTLDLKRLTISVAERSFNFSKNETYNKLARKACEIASRTENGQNAEILIDNAAVKMLIEGAQSIKCELYREICSFLADTANIKIAFRCADTKKTSDFINEAISECVNLNRSTLISRALEGRDSLCEYLSKTVYSKGSEAYLKGPAVYDKWCDDTLTKVGAASKYTAFGFGPVCAYYYGKLNEIKTVRIILSGKLSGADKNVLSERVRKAYV